MTRLADRKDTVMLIEQAIHSGARCKKACAVVGISIRTYQRWLQDGEVSTDQRALAERPEPTHKLSAQERSEVLAVCHQPEFASLPPHQIVPRLADKGCYLASEASFYRILQGAQQLAHRGRSKAPCARRHRPNLCATGPGQVWNWDITYLHGPIRGQFYYLYLFLDLYSRKIVAAEVHESENSAQAAVIVKRAVCAAGGQPPKVLHADNGSPQKGSTLRATLQALGIKPSHSRPGVSDDNPFAESVFRTCKYHRTFPRHGFESLQAARQWVETFVHEYNNVHRHSGIGFVTPAERHAGQDVEILEKRRILYEQARAQNPRRWSGAVRNWQPVGEVYLNPEKPTADPQSPATQAA